MDDDLSRILSETQGRLVALENRVKLLEDDNARFQSGLEQAADMILSNSMTKVMLPEKTRKNLELFVEQRKAARNGQAAQQQAAG